MVGGLFSPGFVVIGAPPGASRVYNFLFLQHDLCEGFQRPPWNRYDDINRWYRVFRLWYIQHGSMARGLGNVNSMIVLPVASSLRTILFFMGRIWNGYHCFPSVLFPRYISLQIQKGILSAFESIREHNLPPPVVCTSYSCYMYFLERSPQKQSFERKTIQFIDSRGKKLGYLISIQTGNLKVMLNPMKIRMELLLRIWKPYILPTLATTLIYFSFLHLDEKTRWKGRDIIPGSLHVLSSCRHKNPAEECSEQTKIQIWHVNNFPTDKPDGVKIMITKIKPLIWINTVDCIGAYRSTKYGHFISETSRALPGASISFIRLQTP